MRILYALDENTGGASSAQPTQTDSGAASTTDKSFEGAMMDAFKKSTIANAHEAGAAEHTEDAAKTETDAVKQESDSKIESNPEEQQKTEVAKEETTTDGEKQTEDSGEGPVPRERFKEVTDKVSVLTQQVQEVEPIVQRHVELINYCRQHNITEEQFVKSLEVQRLINTDPEAALKALLPMVEALQGYVGEKLPDDLNAAVKSGDITMEWAKQLARARAGQAGAQRTAEQVRQQRQQMDQQRAAEQAQTAMLQWEQSKMGTDPDFNPRKDGTFGKFELVRSRFIELTNHQRPQNVSDLVNLAEQAYRDISKARANGHGPVKKAPLTSKTSSTTTSTKEEPPKTVEEAMLNKARDLGFAVPAGKR